jgi:hypothetical protein
VPEAYERLILDAMLGDATLFTREDEVEEQWKLVDAIVGAGAATGRRSRTTRPAAGGRRGRRAAPPRRPLLAAALSVGVVAEIERKLARQRCRRRRTASPSSARAR